MFTESDDGSCTAGPLDAVLILRNTETGMFHTAYLIGDEDANCVRLRTNRTDEEGAPDLAGAIVRLDLLLWAKPAEKSSPRLRIAEQNICRTKARDWDGNPFVLYVSNWLQLECNVGEVTT